MPASSQPLIGITSSLVRNRSGSLVCQVGRAYPVAIQSAGGIPLLIPVRLDDAQLSDLIRRLDGILFTGGADIDPQRFNGVPHPRVYGISLERDALEFALLEKTLSTDKPFLAICRGIQILNVAFGGSLYTHLADQRENTLKHDWFPGYARDRLSHTVSLTPDSLLHSIYGQDDIRVNSLHHQGIQNVGKGLKAIAFAEDGLVEGLSVSGARFALGVQWHPECLPDEPGTQNLFRTFIETC